MFRIVYYLNVISVILLSMLANLIFDMKIDFHASFDLIFIFKITILIISTISFYVISKKLEDFKNEAIKEFYGSSLEEQAKTTMNSIFKNLLKDDVGKIISFSIVFFVFFILYFLVEPICLMLF